MSSSDAGLGGGRHRRLGADRRSDARAHAVVGAFLALLTWWLDAGEGLSAEAVDEIFQGLVAGEALRSPGSPGD